MRAGVCDRDDETMEMFPLLRESFDDTCDDTIVRILGSFIIFVVAIGTCDFFDKPCPLSPIRFIFFQRVVK